MTHRSGKARTQEAFQNLRTAIQATPYPEYEWLELFIRLAAEDDTPLSDASKQAPTTKTRRFDEPPAEGSHRRPGRRCPANHCCHPPNRCNTERKPEMTTMDHQQAAVRAMNRHRWAAEEGKHYATMPLAQFEPLDSDRALLAAATPHLRAAWEAELLGEGVLGAGYSVLMNPKAGEHPVATFTRAVRHMLALLEGGGACCEHSKCPGGSICCCQEGGGE